MSDTLIEAKKAVLADLERRISEMQVHASFLRQELGMSTDEPFKPESTIVPIPASSGTGQLNINELVTPGDFLGMTQVDAIQNFLQRVGKGRPVTLQEVAAALFRGKATDVLLEGLKLKNLSSVLSRNETFLSVARGRWGLTEWYPKSVVEARRKATARTTNGADEVKE
jgi:hypothetical protein